MLRKRVEFEHIFYVNAAVSVSASLLLYPLMLDRREPDRFQSSRHYGGLMEKCNGELLGSIYGHVKQ